MKEFFIFRLSNFLLNSFRSYNDKIYYSRYFLIFIELSYLNNKGG